MDEPLKVSDTHIRRGRPAIWSNDTTNTFRAIYGPMSHRSLVHKEYMAVAHRAILDAANRQEFIWLLEPSTQTIKPSILTELGRVLVKDEASFWEWATLLCNEKPKTHEAVRSIREWRINNL
jgi:hypothetical protein